MFLEKFREKFDRMIAANDDNHVTPLIGAAIGVTSVAFVAALMYWLL